MLSLLTASACESVSQSVEETVVKPQAKIDVTHLGGRWQVEVLLPEPVDRFVFYSTPRVDIRERWEILEAHLRLERAGARDVVLGDAPFRSFTLLVDADDRLIPGAYNLNQSFAGDEGWVLYTGHFLGGAAVTCPTDVQRAPPCGEKMRFDYTVTPRADERFWWRGEVAEEPGRWVSDDHSDAFVYFGPLTPEQSGAVQWLIPSSFPQWIAEELKATLPGFIEQLTARFAQSIEGDLKIMLNTGPGDGSYTASVLRDHIQFELKGDQWSKPNDRALDQLLETLAHEAVHLWNGGKYQHDHSLGHNWLHEGGATAAASLLMRARGQADTDFFAVRSTQLNECLVAHGIPLKEFGLRGRYPLYYSCGAIIELVVEGALRKRNLDGFAHWRRMYAELADETYDLEDYLAAVSATTADAALADWIRRWATDGLERRDEVIEVLRDQGLILEDAPTAGDTMASVGLVRPLMQRDCEGSFSISARDGVITLLGMPRCTISTEDFVVHTVADLSLPEQVAEAYEALSEICGDAGVVEIAGRAGDVVEVRRYPCERPPRYLRITGWAAQAP